MSNLRDEVGSIQNTTYIPKITKHNPPKIVKTDGKAGEKGK